FILHVPGKAWNVQYCFSFAIHGPAQQIIPILSSGFDKDISKCDGVLCRDINGRISETPSIAWDDTWFSEVDWQTLYVLKGSAFEPLTITTASLGQQANSP
nr:hypothetical protein [Candidatus Desulfobacula maris]